MKKTILSWIAYCLFSSLVPACNEGDTTRMVEKDSTIVSETKMSNRQPVSSDSSVLQLTPEILTLLKNRNYLKLANFFHPEGVRFSPYGYIDTARDQRLSAEAFVELATSDTTRKIHWGAYDGSGDSILLTLPGYLKKFVYDVDFLNAEKTSVNKVLGTGNSLDNLQQVYPGSVFTESYFAGFDKKYEGMDWRSLRLVYEKVDGRFFLVAIIHDQWTS